MAQFQISRILDFGPIRLGLTTEIFILDSTSRELPINELPPTFRILQKIVIIVYIVSMSRHGGLLPDMVMMLTVFEYPWGIRHCFAVNPSGRCGYSKEKVCLH